MNTENNKTNVLVYDKSETLIKLIKHYCGNNIEVIFCNCEKDIEELDLKTIDTAYVSSNDIYDFLEIKSIYQNASKIYVASQCDELRVKLSTLKNVVFFDLVNDKYKILDQIYNKIVGFD